MEEKEKHLKGFRGNNFKPFNVTEDRITCHYFIDKCKTIL
jgi:hypothetical protein